MFDYVSRRPLWGCSKMRKVGMLEQRRSDPKDISASGLVAKANYGARPAKANILKSCNYVLPTWPSKIPKPTFLGKPNTKNGQKVVQKKPLPGWACQD